MGEVQPIKPTEPTLNDHKAEAYDLIAKMEYHKAMNDHFQKELVKKNKIIQELHAQTMEENK